LIEAAAVAGNDQQWFGRLNLCNPGVPSGLISNAVMMPWEAKHIVKERVFRLAKPPSLRQVMSMI